jgi:ParB family transcriptional regulator, chromosome partitioning protein
MKKKALGKGLYDLGISELLSDMQTNKAQANTPNLHHIPVEYIEPGTYQPRKEIDPESLEELANSIRAQGIIQPILVRPTTKANNYELIAGERRWRAAQLAGLDKVPAVVKEIPNKAAIAIGLIENIQRENLNVIEEAAALQRLIDEFAMTHQQVAESVGKSRATITNSLRLLKLPAEIKQMLTYNRLEMGHARTLLSLEEPMQIKLAKTIANKQLSVREAEKLVRKQQQPKTNSQPDVNPHIVHIEQSLTEKLSAKVTIKQTSLQKGQLVLHYNSLTELEEILSHIN